MKCSSRRNCDPASGAVGTGPPTCLNEVQFPKELRPDRHGAGPVHQHASMKCSSRRNCDAVIDPSTPTFKPGLNEVQFPKELRLASTTKLDEMQGPQ